MTNEERGREWRQAVMYGGKSVDEETGKLLALLDALREKVRVFLEDSMQAGDMFLDLKKQNETMRAVADAARAVDAWLCHEVRCVDPCAHPPCVLTRRLKELDAKEEPR